jgi:hypothetical protein
VNAHAAQAALDMPTTSTAAEIAKATLRSEFQLIVNISFNITRSLPISSKPLFCEPSTHVPVRPRIWSSMPNRSIMPTAPTGSFALHLAPPSARTAAGAQQRLEEM